MADKKIVEVSTNVDEQYIAAAVQDAVKAAIVAALGDPAELVRGAVNGILSKYVDRDGKVCDKNSYRAIPYLDWVTKRAVEETVRECIAEVIDENKEEFKQAVLHQLRTRKFLNDTASAFCQSILQSASNTWKMPVTVQFEKPKDY